MRLILAVVSSAAFVAAAPCAAQSERDEPRNSIYLESLGNGGLFSINYERLLTPRLGLRLGYGSWDSGDFFVSYGGSRVTTMPIMLNGLFGTGSRRWELGGGILVGSNASEAFQTLTGTVGLRWHAGKSWLFRAGLTPFYGLNGEASYPDEGFFTTAGISFGYRF